MARLSQRILALLELLVSAAVHLLYGFYVFSTAVACDLSQALTAANVADGEGKRRGTAALDGSVPPIVLVHGIFGFGQGRLGGLSYFAGAEKKDDHVLVPDLGSLTSVHDSAGAVLLLERRGGRLRRGAQQGQRALAVREELRAGALSDVGRAPPRPLRRPLRRGPGRPSPAADAGRQGLRWARRHLRGLGAEPHLSVRRPQRNNASVSRRNAADGRKKHEVDQPAPALQDRSHTLRLDRRPLAQELLRLRVRSLRHGVEEDRRRGARRSPARQRRAVRRRRLDPARPDDPGVDQDQLEPPNLSEHLLFQLRDQDDEKGDGAHGACERLEDPPAAARQSPADVPVPVPSGAGPALQRLPGRGLGGQRRGSEHGVHDAPAVAGGASEPPGVGRVRMPSDAAWSLVLQSCGGRPHLLRCEQGEGGGSVRCHVRWHIRKMQEARVQGCPAAGAARWSGLVVAGRSGCRETCR